MENLSAMWENFSLSEFEGSKYQVHDSGFERKRLLVVRFVTGRVLNMEAIARNFKLLWHTKKGFKVCDIGNHRVLFVFSKDSDIEKVISGELWSFDKYLVALKRVQRHTNLKGLDFDKVCFWI